MNKRQKLVQQQFLNNEEAVIKQLNEIYTTSKNDIEDKIKNLDFTIGKLQQQYDWMDPDDPERAKMKSRIQSKIYQKNYQEQLEKQVDGILKQMQTQSYLTVSDYLDDCYTDGFVGTIFDAHGQGIPIVTPIDQEAMVRAVQLESKISKGLYNRLGEDVGSLKKKITAQVSRSIATGMTYAQTAKALENYTRIGYNNAIRIARTEGHRIQTTATMDAMYAAKEVGADVVKQWDATLDGKTRPSHAAVDGEIRELNKPFSNGLDFPGDPHGKAAEVVNCRCALLQRARSALDEDELQTLKDRAEFFGLDKSEQFDDFKKNYLKASDEIEKLSKLTGANGNEITNNTKGFFTPAKTMADAESFASQFVDSQYPNGLGVSYDGADIDTMNAINKTLFDFYSTFDIEKLGGISVVNPGSMYYNQLGDNYAAFSTKKRSLLINRRGIKATIEGLAEEKDFVKRYIENPSPMIFDDPFVKQIMEASIDSGRAMVPETFADVIHHELGHAVHSIVKGVDEYTTIQKNRSTFGKHISGYATTSEEDYIADSFTSYLKGENIIDPELRKVFDRLKRG